MKTRLVWCLLRDHLLLAKKWQKPPKVSLGNTYFVLRFYYGCVNPIDLLSSKALTGVSEEYWVMHLHRKRTENIVYTRVWTICDKEYIICFPHMLR